MLRQVVTTPALRHPRLSLDTIATRSTPDIRPRVRRQSRVGRRPYRGIVATKRSRPPERMRSTASAGAVVGSNSRGAAIAARAIVCRVWMRARGIPSGDRLLRGLHGLLPSVERYCRGARSEAAGRCPILHARGCRICSDTSPFRMSAHVAPTGRRLQLQPRGPARAPTLLSKQRGPVQALAFWLVLPLVLLSARSWEWLLAYSST